MTDEKTILAKTNIEGEVVLVSFGEGARAFLTVGEFERLTERKRIVPQTTETNAKMKRNFCAIERINFFRFQRRADIS